MSKDIKEISKSATIYFVANIFTKAVAFFLVPVYTIFFTPEEYGILNVIIITADFIYIFYILGLKASISRFIFDYEHQSDKQKKFLGLITVFTFIVGLFLSIVFSIFGKNFFPLFFKEVPFFPFLFIAIWIAFFRIFWQIKLAIFQVRQQAYFYTLLDSGFIIANVLLTIVIVVIFKKGLLGKVYMDFALILVFSIISLILLVKDIKLNFKFKQLKAPLRFSLPLIPHMLSGFLLAAIDRIFLERFADLSQVGLYSLAFNIGMILYMFINAVRLSYTPYFNKTAVKEGKKANPKFAKFTTYGFLLYTVAGIMLILFSKEFITIIVNKNFHEAYSVFPVIILTNIFNGLYFFFVRPLLFMKKNTHFVSIATIITAVINIILNYFLITEHGMIGAAWATFISIIIKVTLIYIFAQKKYFIKYEFKRLSVLFVIIFISIGSFYLFEYIDLNILYSVIFKSLVFLVLFFIILLTKFLNKKEISFIEQIFRNNILKKIKK